MTIQSRRRRMRGGRGGQGFPDQSYDGSACCPSRRAATPEIAPGCTATRPSTGPRRRGRQAAGPPARAAELDLAAGGGALGSSPSTSSDGWCCTWDNVFDKTRVCGKSFRMRCCTPRRGLGIHRGRRWGFGIHRGRRRGLGIHRGRL